MTVVAPTAGGIPAAAWKHRLGEKEPAGKPRVEAPLIDDGPTGGVPIGGIGSGSIGRTADGDFARWHLKVGTHRFAPDPGCGFSLIVNGKVQATRAGTYHALFPRAWVEHEVPGLRVVERQLSPVIAHSYRESSYPVGLFRWTLENTGTAPLDVAVELRWRAQDEEGTTPPSARGEVRRDEGRIGVVLDNGIDDAGRPQGQFAIAGATGEGIRATALSNGEPLGATVRLAVDLAPGETRTLDFALAWDFPLMRFGSGRSWYRRYTRFFGREGAHAWDIALEALGRQDEWERAIEDWQRPLLEDTERPAEYAAALFNELYLMVDGGTAWEDGLEGEPAPADATGRFAILECFDYPFYNTHDVLFYASWALARNWPLLEASVLRSFARTIAASDDRLVTIETTGERAVRKVAGAAAHDVGSPSEDPWMVPNAYHYQDPNRWKDLNAMFVLQVWRDLALPGAATILDEAWPAVTAALATLAASDTDGDGLPDHDGGPDQTFDTWPMQGPSAYGGGLWISALAAAERMAAMVGDEASGLRYAEMRSRAVMSLRSRLWNGRYLRYDGGSGPSSDSVMADQLCGLWWADATGLPAYLDPTEARRALTTIFESNVRGFASGRMGAVNGARPDGAVDLSNEQSQEVWPGVTYSLAALLLSRDLTAEAWQTALGAIDLTYRRGFAFRTPEAWDRNGDFRASMYLRPLAIWAIERALEMRRTRPA